jgi:hypothetical protein
MCTKKDPAALMRVGSMTTMQLTAATPTPSMWSRISEDASSPIAQPALSSSERSDFRGERALMVAVLLDALSIFYKTEGVRDHRKRLEFREVHGWIFADGADGPFSFENVCGAIGIDADALRDSLKGGRRMPKQRERYFRHVVASPSAKAA